MDNKECYENTHKKTKNKKLTSTNLDTSKADTGSENSEIPLTPQCPLLAKDSEWVDILQNSPYSASSKRNDEEEVLQLVDSEDGPQIKPLTLMFPGLLEKGPEMLEGILNKVMSTTEVTKHLVGQKANFEFMKKVNRLIPTDKKWLESLTENNTSCCSMESKLQNNGSDYEADSETSNGELTFQTNEINQ